VNDRATPWLALRSAELSAEINPLGAELSSLRDGAGRDLLWNGDAAVWAGRAPLLFPIVGALAGGVYRLGAKSYALPRHGFARRRVFEVIEASATYVRLRLRPDTASRLVYPFQFELEVEFTLAGPTLSITSTVRNPGSAPLLASFGFHPAFRWPLPYGEGRADHALDFPEEEPAPTRRLDADGLLTGERHTTPIVRRRLPLTDALFEADVLIFDTLQSRYVTYGAARGPRIRVSFADAPYLGLWTRPGAGFICIEPWHGIADPAGYGGDFSAKPGVFQVLPGASRPLRMAITWLADEPA
jgi:galactose mutarotase-like enzyme